MENQVVLAGSVADANRVASFFKSIWQDGEDVAPADLILASLHVGGYCSYIEQNDAVVAASFGFRGVLNGESILHSHVTASSVPGFGFNLKQHQKLWASTNEIDAITWTVDPLVRRNAVFNFEKLGAVAIEYLPNFYGSMADSINLGDESDRLFIRWPVSLTEAAQPAIGETKWIELPADIESLRKSDEAAAKEWRLKIREAMLPWFESGAIIRSINAERTAVLIERRVK